MCFEWQARDLLYLDNLVTAHGRTAYSGGRNVLVAMGQPHRRGKWR